MALGFWDTFFDSEYRQRRDINQALGNEEVLAVDVQNAQAQLQRLNAKVTELSITVAVLLQMMGEHGTLDPAGVKARVDAVLEAMRGPRPTPQELAHPKPPPLNTAPLTCVKCGRSVPANLTLMTENGPTCDPACP